MKNQSNQKACTWLLDVDAIQHDNYLHFKNSTWDSGMSILNAFICAIAESKQESRHLMISMGFEELILSLTMTSKHSTNLRLVTNLCFNWTHFFCNVWEKEHLHVHVVTSYITWINWTHFFCNVWEKEHIHVVTSYITWINWTHFFCNVWEKEHIHVVTSYITWINVTINLWSYMYE